MNLRITYLLILVLLTLGVRGQSVFSDGSWYKLGVTQGGIYMLDRDLITNVLGINVSSLDANTIKVYGFNGGMLPQENSAAWYRDPPEIPLLRKGTQDGRLDNEDYLLFFAQGPDKTKIKTDGSLSYEKNLYSDTSYYFLTFGGDAGLQLEDLASQGEGILTINTFDDYLTYEKDETNILGSGREWFGERFGGSSGVSRQDFNYEIPGILDSVGVFTHLIGQSESPGSFELLLNQNTLGTVAIDSIPSVTSYSDFSRVRYTFRGTESYGVFSKNNFSSNDLRLTFRFDAGASSSGRAYIDYFILGFKRNLQLYGNQTQFRSTLSVGNAISYQIQNADPDDINLWDITDPVTPKIQQFVKAGNGIHFGSAQDTLLNEYIIFQGSDFPNPSFFGEVTNQNIKGQTSIDGLIISAPVFLNTAERLADFHQSNDGLSVAVVTTNQVYNEFSSGRQDISAIRNFIRYVWQNGGRLKYVLLMGDASYDYKNRLNNNTNFVPVYESRQSFHRLYSHSSDDYFGFLEDEEGYWDEGVLELYNGTRFPIGYTDHTLDVGIGRLPVKNLEEADDVVNKIIRYATSVNALGKWRSEAVYMADDGDGAVHMRQSETVNKIVREGYAEVNVDRLYLDNFKTVESMQDAFLDKMTEGALILDFLGHGSPSALMQRNEENRLKTVITIPLLEELKNRHRLPLFMTATCNFGQYDNPIFVSGGENMMLNPNGGAIALLTTTRAVFSSTNLPLNEAFQEAVLSKQNGRYPRLGDVIRQTKNNSLAGPINRNFALMGDPMLMLNYPGYEIVFDELESETDTLSALEKVTISGKVFDNSTEATYFNGSAIVTVLDIPRERYTLGLDNSPFEYQEQENALFRGAVSVTNGAFETTFIMPKNSSYRYQNGTITAYAFSEQDNIDASGASRSFVLGGTDRDAVQDTKSPSAQLYLNEPTFKNGDLVGSNSLFIAKLSDESGISISTNGFSQSLKLVLNDKEPIILNDFYTAELDDYTKGTIVYPIQNLEPGYYIAELTVWDTYNNSSSWPIEFRVSDKPILNLYDVINYPNPISAGSSTTFSFEHDRIGEELVVSLEIYDTHGRKVSSWTNTFDDSPRRIEYLKWDATNYSGQPIGKGVYFYRLEVSSTLDGGRASAVKRILIQ